MDLPHATSVRLPNKDKMGYIIAADTSMKKGCPLCVALGMEWSFSYHRDGQICFVRDTAGTLQVLDACRFTQTTLKNIIPRKKVTPTHHPNPNGVEGRHAALSRVLSDDNKVIIFGLVAPTLLRAPALREFQDMAHASSARLQAARKFSAAKEDAEAMRVAIVIRDFIRAVYGADEFAHLNGHGVSLSNTAVDQATKAVAAIINRVIERADGPSLPSFDDEGLTSLDDIILRGDDDMHTE